MTKGGLIFQQIRRWKLLKCEDRAYLFNFEEDLSESENLIHKSPLVSEGLEKKLSNENFVKRAPEAVVTQTKAQLDNMKSQLDNISTSLKALS